MAFGIVLMMKSDVVSVEHASNPVMTETIMEQRSAAGDFDRLPSRSRAGSAHQQLSPRGSQMPDVVAHLEAALAVLMASQHIDREPWPCAQRLSCVYCGRVGQAGLGWRSQCAWVIGSLASRCL